MVLSDDESGGDDAQREWQGLATLVREATRREATEENEPDLVRAQRRARFVAACAAQARGGRRPATPLARALRRLGRPWRSARWAWGTATAFVVGAALLVIFGRLAVAPVLSYRVTGAQADGGYLQLTETAAPADVSFSDGSHIQAQPATRMRIAGVGARGAHLVLERGRLDVDVNHRPRAGWTIEAGPYAVAVTGTAFSVRWENEELSVVMARGSVMVRGPSAPAGVAVLGGQQLRARPRDHLLSVVDRTAVPPVVKTPTTASPSVEADIDGPAPASAEPEGPASRSPRGGDGRAWPRRIAAGEYALVLREAEDRGLNAVLAGVSVTDLAALADAARYLHRSDVARRALLVERSRFPRSQEARAAAFLLARIIEEDGDPTAAVDGYGRYLNESPRGPFAQEALGRQVALLWKRGERATALPLARTYLRRFPRGPYAPIARDIADGP
ncbi:MAG TPA: FecR family protein [Polyangia bacterium]|nr:FecR family protein [Polyangia bacterium]